LEMQFCLIQTIEQWYISKHYYPVNSWTQILLIIMII